MCCVPRQIVVKASPMTCYNLLAEPETLQQCIEFMTYVSTIHVSPSLNRGCFAFNFDKAISMRPVDVSMCVSANIPLTQWSVSGVCRIISDAGVEVHRQRYRRCA
eukprot:5792506-Pyramimonas_sp.AAC.2